ncbi:MAG TPA: dihydrodipicolinate synthase family protein [Terriglobales bacterium]|nr:dihydrodipicolinate synthase family protein [Terriglobales bacterium]
MATDWNRRDFLRASVLAGTAAALPQVVFARHAANSNKLSPADFKHQLRGPIVSIPTPFTREYSLDAVGIRRMIDNALQYGIRIFVLTAGDSQYLYLSYDEIKQLARLVTDAVGQRGITIIGTGAWWTDRTIDFAHYAEKIGATALQVLKPTGTNEDTVVEHFKRISEATKLPLVLHGNFPMPELGRLTEIASVVALKEDISLEYYVDGIIRYGNRINCFSGGGLDWFVVGQPYGATAYFDSFATFAPEISAQFWEAVKRNDYRAETEIIAKYDHPFIKNFSAPFWHATLEYFGIAQRYLRPPQPSYTDAEMLKVKEFYDQMHLRPRKKSA